MGSCSQTGTSQGKEREKGYQETKSAEGCWRCVLEDSVCSLSAGCSLDMGVGLWYALIMIYFSVTCYAVMSHKVWSMLMIILLLNVFSISMIIVAVGYEVSSDILNNFLLQHSLPLHRNFLIHLESDTIS